MSNYFLQCPICKMADRNDIVEIGNDDFLCTCCGAVFSQLNNLSVEQIFLNGSLCKMYTLRNLGNIEESKELLQMFLQDNQEISNFYQVEITALWNAFLCKHSVVSIDYFDGKMHFARLDNKKIDYDEDFYLKRLFELLEDKPKLAAYYESKIEEIKNYDRITADEYKKEGEYDVFLCYAGVDPDKQYAYKVERLLSESEQIRTFFAPFADGNRIEEQNWRAKISAALICCKVMIVLFYDVDNLQRPNVKNEWLRFAAQIKKGAKKTIIPCGYVKNLNELPAVLAEFNFESADYSKICKQMVPEYLGINPPQTEKKKKEDKAAEQLKLKAPEKRKKKRPVLIAALLLTLLCLTLPVYFLSNYIKFETEKTNYISEINNGTAGLKFDLLPDDTYAVSRGSANKSGEIIIPASFNNAPVTEIKANGFRDYAGLESIIIPESIRYIGVNAFDGTGLSDSNSIANYAGFVSADSPAEKFQIEVTSKVWLLRYFSAADSVTLNEMTYGISSSAFMGIPATEITLPAAVSRISILAFEKCVNLKTIVLLNESVIPLDGMIFEANKKVEIKVLASAYSDYMSSAVWSDYADTIKISARPGNVYTVFNSNGGSGVEYQEFLRGTKVDITKTTTQRPGYRFDGWYDQYGFIFDLTKPVYESIELYAKWIPNDNTLYFNKNGGLGEDYLQTIATDAVATLKELEYAKAGYTFTGWAETADGEVMYLDGADYKMGKDSSYTLYAIWQANSNTLNFNKNGGSGNDYTQTIATDAAAVLKEIEYVRAGYKFIGWAESANGAVVYLDGADYLMGANSSYTLYAIWQANGNTLNFNKNGGLGEDYSQTISTDKTVSLKAVEYTKAGYTFTGWAETADGEVVYLDGANYTMGANLSYMLYAIWKANNNTLNFNKNGGLGVNYTQTIKTENTVSLKAVEYTRAGYTFAGWAETADGEVVYLDGADYEMGTGASYTLYAIWKANNNTLNFNKNGGLGGNYSQTISTDKTAKLRAVEYTKAGYTFAGWAESANGAVVYLDGANYTMGTDASYTLYAIWKANNNTLNFNKNGGLGKDYTQTIATDAVAALKEVAYTKAGYTFTGWAETADGEAVYLDGADYEMGTNSSYTLYAIWKANVNVVIFYANGGDGASYIQCLKTDATAKLRAAEFSRDGYTFAGWAETADGEVVYLDGADYIMGTEPTYKLYAKWEALPFTVTYNLNFEGMPMNAIDESITVFYGGSYLLAVPKRSDYTFGGWFNAAEGGVQYTDMQGVSLGTWIDSEDKMLYARWLQTANLTFRLINNNEEYTVRAGGNLTGTVYIPEYFSNKPVTCIDINAFADCQMTGIVLPEGLKVVSEEAFIGCDKLTVIVLPDSLAVISIRAFVNCSKLEEIVIPINVTVIDDEIFSGCTELKEVIFEGEITSIGDEAFYGCTGITTITIPATVTYVGSKAFRNWKVTQRIEIAGTDSRPMEQGWSSAWRTNCSATVIWLGND